MSRARSIAGRPPARWPVLLALLGFVLAQGAALHHFATVAHEGGACHHHAEHADGEGQDRGVGDAGRTGREWHAGDGASGTDCPLAPFLKDSPFRWELRAEASPRSVPGEELPYPALPAVPSRESRYRLAPKTSPPLAA